jgi:hypothetical protein
MITELGEIRTVSPMEGGGPTIAQPRLRPRVRGGVTGRSSA